MSTDHMRPLGGNEELDYAELVRELWKGRWLIFATTLVFLLVAGAYVFIKPSLYEAKATVRAPSQDDIASLNIGRGGRSGLGLLDSKEVYGVYLRSLQSESVRRQFFKTVYLPALQKNGGASGNDAAYSQFNSELDIVNGDPSQPHRTSVSMLAREPQTAVDWVYRYTQIAAEQAIKQLVNDVRSDARTKADSIERQIEIDRDSARKQREDKVVQLNEALRIARETGIEKPPFISASLTPELSSEMSGGLAYMRGSKALAAELDTLMARTSDDPYIPGLRQQEADLAFYRKMIIDPATTKVYQQDGEISVPDQPVKTRAALILIVSSLFGVFLGLVLVFVRKVLKDAGQRSE